jgi:SAM-dependent methyltransferase
MKHPNPRLIEPITRATLSLSQDGNVLTAQNGKQIPVINQIPRFVGGETYARAFGDQWNLFPKTQLDSYSGVSLSAIRLERCLGHDLDTLKGQVILEAGSGAGRFTEILLKHGAVVDSFDFSHAVEANYANNSSHKNLTLVQADLLNMPFKPASYDTVLCLGVLQHTPDPERCIQELWSRVKPGGRLVFDHYRRKIRNYLPPPIGVGGMAYRWYFLRLPPEKQFATAKKVFDFWFPVVWKFRKSKVIQFMLARFSPIVNYYPHFGLKNREMYYEWMLLDTHDATTDVYKHRRTKTQIKKLLASMGAAEILVNLDGNGIEASCTKPFQRAQ